MIDVSSDAKVARFVAGQQAGQVLSSYALACDQRDEVGLAALFHPDATADYDDAPRLTGASTIAGWILEATAHLTWQQHGIRIMSAEVTADGQRADVVGYLTSHQVALATPDSVLMMNSRYDLTLVLVEDNWVIEHLRLVVGTIENRPVQLGALVKVAEASHV